MATPGRFFTLRPFSPSLPPPARRSRHDIRTRLLRTLPAAKEEERKYENATEKRGKPIGRIDWKRSVGGKEGAGNGRNSAFLKNGPPCSIETDASPPLLISRFVGRTRRGYDSINSSLCHAFFLSVQRSQRERERAKRQTKVIYTRDKLTPIPRVVDRRRGKNGRVLSRSDQRIGDSVLS